MHKLANMNVYHILQAEYLVLVIYYILLFVAALKHKVMIYNSKISLNFIFICNLHDIPKRKKSNTSAHQLYRVTHAILTNNLNQVFFIFFLKS